MPKTILILETPDNLNNKDTIGMLKDLVKDKKNIKLSEEGNILYFSSITDRENVIDNEEGKTFLGQAHYNYEKMLQITMLEVAEYAEDYYPEETQNPQVQQWIKLIDNDPLKAHTFFHENELYNIIKFHWNTSNYSI